MAGQGVGIPDPCLEIHARDAETEPPIRRQTSHGKGAVEPDEADIPDADHMTATALFQVAMPRQEEADDDLVAAGPPDMAEIALDAHRAAFREKQRRVR